MSARTQRKTTPARRKTKKRKPIWRRIRWVRLMVLGTVGLFVILGAYVGALYALAKIPEPNAISRAQSVRVVDRDGALIGRIHAAADRVSIPLKDMPAHLQDAVVATEDRHFYEHKGVRVTSIVRAAIANLIGRGIRQGGSTITQQYVKNAFVGSERTMVRKAKEAVLALKLERQRSKREILELYLNTIYFGRGAYGVDAASRAYFGKSAKAITLPEAAMLAGIIRAPEEFDPAAEPERARARRDLVLSLMARQERITGAEAAHAKDARLTVRKRRLASGLAAHTLEDVRRVLERRFGRELYERGRITVTATLDRDAQEAAEKAVRDIWPSASDPQVALAAIDPRTGAVRALVGGRSFDELQLNLATQARRQPGSTFKPAVLAAAIGDGMSIGERYRAPERIQIRGYPKPISNYDGRDYGTLTVEEATWQSVNTVYAQLIEDVGAGTVVDEAHLLGIRSKLDPIVGLALGVNEVTPLELASMYATLAARGAYHEPYLVEKVARGSRVLFEATREDAQGIDRDVADTVNHVLQGVVSRGTGSRASIGRPQAGKTGTTQENVDAWYAGYTPDLAAVVWNGFPQKRIPLRAERSASGCTARFGGSCPAEIWKRFARVALRGVSPTAFAKPDLPAPSTSASASATPTPPATVFPSLSPTVVPSATAFPSSKEPDPEPSPSGPASPAPTTSDAGGG